MNMNIKDIKQGQILKIVTDNFTTSGEDTLEKKYLGNRAVLLRKHELIEIRYAYEWHFRTEDAIYFHATPEMIASNCEIFGVVDEKIEFNNNASLEEILRLGLYEGENYYQHGEKRAKEREVKKC